MEKQRKRIGANDIILLAVSVIFLIGMLTFLRPCAAGEDGWMTCHWAGQAVRGIAALLIVISLLHMLISNPQIRIGLSLAMIPIALLAVIIPGNLISLCMMNTMRCHAVMRPGIMVFAVIIAVAVIIDIICQLRRK